MARGNVELVQECLPKHLRLGTARMKEDKGEVGKKKRVNIETSTADTKKGSPGGLAIARVYRPPLVATQDDTPNQTLHT